ncbi:MAG: hypothetical protein RLZZ28_651 [Bacteroidota bacterium]|jgi:NADH-quinone oxidoreductase subunit M
MIPVSLILIPLITGIIAFFLKEAKLVRSFVLLSSLITLLFALAAAFFSSAPGPALDVEWLPSLGSRFSLMMDGMGKMLCLLTAVSFPAIFIAIQKNEYKNSSSFYGLMLLSQAGLMGVFLAADALLFYFFWELALIPVYFLCSIWGGEKRIAVTFKFFVYTFLGSLLMLAGLLYLYFHTADHSFSLNSFYHISLSGKQEAFIFWLFFIAFAIKMPIFPFHTWQPDAYEQSPTATTMVMSGIMVKMGIFAVIRWLIPVFPHASIQFAHLIILLAITGMIYASLIAFRQDDIKRLVAYSSIAHIGLICAAIFTQSTMGLQGAMIQMFNHGINVIGLWILVDTIEQKMGTRKLSELGGLAQKAPVMAILFVVMALANIALPLTNAFVGEFLMFNGLFSYHVLFTAFAGISIILAAVYTLQMVQKVLYGNTSAFTEKAVDITANVKWVLIVFVIIILVLGVYPQPMLDLTIDTVKSITTKS